MRIGLIAPPWIPVPPPAYGGTEEGIDNLARGLTALGHDVRLFTVGESTCPVPRRWLYRSPAEPMGDHFREAAHVLAAYQALADDVDIIHDHTELGPLLAGRRGISRPPIVTTVHGPVTAHNRRTLAEVARHASIVAIVRALPLLRRHPGGGGHPPWHRPGRLQTRTRDRRLPCYSPAGCPLIRAGITQCGSPAARAGRWSSRRRSASPPSGPTSTRPLLGPDDDIRAEQPLAARVELMRRAAALVNPITWPEPFGLVMAEALAAATPVLAFPNGAAPEIIDHGRTGYLCRDEDDMTAAAAHIGEIDRWQCRAAAERRFSLARMAADYERLYRAILEHPGRVTTGRTGTGAL
jgi:glycosyltransferase involved in cell wall biosynthesis